MCVYLTRSRVGVLPFGHWEWERQNWDSASTLKRRGRVWGAGGSMQKGLLFRLSVSLMHLVYKPLLPSPVLGTWDVEVTQPLCHPSKNSF